MHRTQLAATDSYVGMVLRTVVHIGAVLAVAFQLVPERASAAELRLDLTHVDVEPGDSESGWALGVLPSVSSGSFSGMKPLLPLSISIRDISPRAATPLDSVALEVVLRNVGKDPVLLPFRSGHHWRAGVHGQREISFMLELTPLDGKRMLIPLGVAYGASDIPGSMVTLSPDDTLAFHTSASLHGTELWSDLSAIPLQVKVAVNVGESRYHDTRFELTTSGLGTATSAVPLTWSETK